MLPEDIVKHKQLHTSAWINSCRKERELWILLVRNKKVIVQRIVLTRPLLESPWCLVYTKQCFPTEHSLPTLTEVRHECTQVHDEKRSSKLAKSISVPFKPDKPIICHSEKKYTRAKSRILSCHMHACDRYRGMGFWAVLEQKNFLLSIL